MLAPERIAEPLVRANVVAAPAITPVGLSLNMAAALPMVMLEVPFIVPVRLKVPAPVNEVAPV